jgi:type II protein arginine methyltransferase
MNPDVLHAKQLYETGRFDEAAQLCRGILARNPQDSEANHLLGLIFYRQGQNRMAADFLQRAVASGSATARMYSNLGAVLNALGDLGGAVTAYRRAIERDPANPWPLNNLGVLYRTAGQTEEAIESFRRAIAVKPNFADAQINLRLIYSAIVPQWHFAMMNDRHRNDAFEAAIRRAVAGKRSRPGGQLRSGRCHCAAGKRHRREERIRRSGQDYPEALDGFGCGSRPACASRSPDL